MRSQVLVSGLFGFVLCAALGQAPVESSRVPLQAELLKLVHVRHLAKGSTIFAKVTVDWNGPDCVLRKGAIVEGVVEAAEPRKGRADSTLALSFTRAQCNGNEMTPVKLVLGAIAEAPLDYNFVPGVQFSTPMVAFGGAGGIGSNGPVISDMNTPRLEFTGIAHRFPAKSDVRPGDVVGIKGLKLTVGKGPNRSSVLSSLHDVSLSAFTQLLLMPASASFAPTAMALTGPATDSAAHASEPLAPLPPPAPPVNTIETCAPPGCVVDLPVTPKELEGHTATSMSVRSLGFKPRTRKVLESFDEEQAMAWLGPNELLFSFNAHTLIRRANVSGGTARIVRAVILDTRTRSILRAVDWEIRDAQRYLWQLDGTRILVHVGDELRVYRAGLEVEHTIPLAGPLVFVRISPNGELIALATLRERHSPTLHAQLREQLGNEPEEDVDIRVLDKNFKTLASAATVSGIMPPTVLNEGQVTLFAQPNLGYRLSMNTWQNKAATLARFESLCKPEFSSIAPDLLFLLSCDSRVGDTEYSVLRPDGKLILRGNASPMQVGFEASGNGRTFALRVVNASRDISKGINFTAADLVSEELRVYRAEDGKRMASVLVNDPPTSHGTYALSADGSQLAVLSGSEIKFFAIPSE